MKVLYVIPYDWGGLPQYTSELANAVSKYEDVVVLASKGIKTSYFSDDVEIIKIFDKLSFTVKDLKKALSLNGLSGFLSSKEIKIIDDIRPDIIHFTTPLLPTIPIFMRLYGLNSRYPMAHTKHHLRLLSGFCLESFAEVVVNLFEGLINCNKIIVHTQNDKMDWIKTGKFKEDMLEVIPHGIFDLFKNCSHEELSEGSNPDLKSILFFGYIKKYKGLECLLRAVPLINKEVNGVKTIIAGEGDLSPYQELISKCDNSTLEIHNEYLSDEQVSALFKRASIVVLPYTRMSGESGVLKVAYAFDKPVISTNVGGFCEALKDNETGYLVPPNDPVSLAQATIQLLKDDNLRMKMSKSIRKMRQELSWDAIARRHIDVYKQIIITHRQTSIWPTWRPKALQETRGHEEQR